MFFKFIGEDGLMELDHGRVYDVHIESKNTYIWVRVFTPEVMRHGLSPITFIPYESPQSFAANWCKP